MRALRANMQDSELAAFVRRKIADSKRKPPMCGRAPQSQGGRKRPARCTADMNCPNCLEKGHTRQECLEAKADLKDRKCFICGEKGHTAS